MHLSDSEEELKVSKRSLVSICSSVLYPGFSKAGAGALGIFSIIIEFLGGKSGEDDAVSIIVVEVLI